MPESITALRLFVASPSDTQPERDAVDRVLDELNRGIAASRGLQLIPVKWETDVRPGIGSDAQDVINRQIAPPDVFVGIFWKRVGTQTPRAESGTAEEIERAIAQWRSSPGGIEILVYFNQQPFTPRPSDMEQLVGVQTFRAKLQEAGLLVSEYSGPADFETKLRGHLTSYVRDWAPAAPAAPDPPSGPPPATPEPALAPPPIPVGALVRELDTRDSHRRASLVAETLAWLEAEKFSKRTRDRTALVLLELTANVRQYVEDAIAVVEVEVRDLPPRYVSIDVYHRGPPVMVDEVVEKDRGLVDGGDREHGLLKLARLTGNVHQATKYEDEGRHGVGTYVYELAPVHSRIFERFPFVGPVAVEYEWPRRFWVGDHLSIGDHFMASMRFGADRASRPLLDLYFDAIRGPGVSCLGVEYTGTIVPSEVGPQFDPLMAALEVSFEPWFESGRVILFANTDETVVLSAMRDWAARWKLPCHEDWASCQEALLRLESKPH